MVYTERAEMGAVSRGTSHVRMQQPEKRSKYKKPEKRSKYTTSVDIQNVL